MYSPLLWRALVVHFCEAASAAPNGVRTFCKPGAYEKYSARRGGLTRSEKMHLRKGYAISQWRRTTPHDVYANFPMHASVADLLDSAAHEAVHLRWRGLNGCTRQGNLFKRRVGALLDGYRCGPKGSRLPAAFR